MLRIRFAETYMIQDGGLSLWWPRQAARNHQRMGTGPESTCSRARGCAAARAAGGLVAPVAGYRRSRYFGCGRIWDVCAPGWEKAGR